MKINWKARLVNPTFWMHIAVSFFVPIFAHLRVNWAQMTSWALLFQVIAQALQNPVVVLAIAVSVWNCILDPTSKGLGDNKQLVQTVAEAVTDTASDTV